MGNQESLLGPLDAEVTDEDTMNIASDARREVVGIRYGSGNKDINNNNSKQKELTSYRHLSKEESIDSFSTNKPVVPNINSDINIPTPMLDLYDQSVRESSNLVVDSSSPNHPPPSYPTEIYNNNSVSINDPFAEVNWTNTCTEPRWDFEMVDMFNSMWYDPLSSIDGGRAAISSIQRADFI